LLRVVNLLDEVDDGQILLDGEDVADPRLDANRVRARMGMVFQAYNLFPHLTVLDNVTLAPRLVHRRGRAEAEAAAVEMLGRVGLGHKVTAYPDQLSGGEQQRAAIARALVNGPELLLLDEVTSALDPELVGEVLDLLAELRSEGRTMLVATHEMGFARRVADEVCFLHEGRVHERGTPEQVLGDPQRERTGAFLRRLHARPRAPPNTGLVSFCRPERHQPRARPRATSCSPLCSAVRRSWASRARPERGRRGPGRVGRMVN